jgi:hypothetical protein
VAVVLYKCGRKLLLRAARVFVELAEAPSEEVEGGDGGRRGGGSRGRGRPSSKDSPEGGAAGLGSGFDGSSSISSRSISSRSISSRSISNNSSSSSGHWHTSLVDAGGAARVDGPDEYPDKGLWHDPRLEGGGFGTVLPAGRWARSSRGQHPTWRAEGWAHATISEGASGRSRSTGGESGGGGGNGALPAANRERARAGEHENVPQGDDAVVEPAEEEEEGLEVPGGGWAPNEVCSERRAVRFLDPFRLTRPSVLLSLSLMPPRLFFPSRVL